MKVAFIVGSFITPYQGGSGSAYSIKERINQTHETLKSIRERCPEAKIYFVEGSETDISECGFDYDELIRPTNDFEAKKLIYSLPKSPGECIMMIYTANNINLEEYDLVLKISGRYTLTDDFGLDNFSQNVWKEVLQKSLSHMAGTKIDSIEISIRNCLNVKYVQCAEKLGIQGFNAPMRRYIRY